MSTQQFDIGMVGLGVMGRSLALNMADHGHGVAGYDKDTSKGPEFLGEGAGKKVGFGGTPTEFVQILRKPRTILLLVAPAKVVDFVIDDLTPLLEPGDLIIDGGNSYFKDTDRRAKALEARSIRFFGMGVSGGESGARHGPSMMPGGPRESWERVRPLLESCAAKVNGEPCVAYVGKGSSGHYVKMVHNGIEYGLMQLLAETYDLMKRGAGLTNDEIHQTFDSWNKGELNSYLVEITAHIFTKNDDLTAGRLIDRILDLSRQKGTGKWTSEEGLNLGVPIPTIDMAVTMRNLSAAEALRKAAHPVLKGTTQQMNAPRQSFLQQLQNAYQAAKILTYAQGLDLLAHASKTYDYGLNLGDIAKIWRGGCIIRSVFLEDIRAAYHADANLLHLALAPRVAEKLSRMQSDLRAVTGLAVQHGIPAMCLTSALGYYDAIRSGWLPANLIQAQRDFCAHTYERTDRPGSFHTQWEA